MVIPHRREEPAMSQLQDNTAATARRPEPAAASADPAILSAHDQYLFNEGSHYRAYRKLGAHPGKHEGKSGTWFAVWAPGAEQICVMGDFNNWNTSATPLHPQGASGVWQGFVAGVGNGAHYKYHIVSHSQGYRVEKSDPVGFFHEIPPKTASIVWDLEYAWNDSAWMKERGKRNSLSAPISIYEVHLGSWRRVPHEGNRSLSYRETAHQLAEYVKHMGFTHVEFLPLCEHPFFGSWGYQTTGYFAPTSRYGTPQDFMYLIDHLHQNGIGVILDWVPSHFPNDGHGLSYFDGTHLFEHADPQQGYHPDWNSCIFNYDRHEVRSFLLSSALFWLDAYHIDGLRVDAVASMLYLDYSRKPGEWVPNAYGGNENLGAISLLRRFNEEVYRNYPDVQTFAEESTAWPMVSRPVYLGGLGFGLKWDMGWMHDTLLYMHREPIHRQFHHGELLFRMIYAYSENYVLPLSHDEVVHGKGSLMEKMPGDDWQKAANLRLMYGYMYGMPGKKLLFMGNEWGQWRQWNHDASLDWDQTWAWPHNGIQRWVADINRLYREEPALCEMDCRPGGFEWVDLHESTSSVISFLRKRQDGSGAVLVACNFTPVPRPGYRLGVPREGYWRECLNSDAGDYGGSGQGNRGGLWAEPLPWHGHQHSLLLTLPPLSVLFFKSPG
jgi:1,4-alpha-glucan branching enzyme